MASGRAEHEALRAAGGAYGSVQLWLAVPPQDQICAWVPDPP